MAYSWGKRRDDVLDDWVTLSRQGLTVPEAAERIGMKPTGLLRALVRARAAGDPRAVYNHTGMGTVSPARRKHRAKRRTYDGPTPAPTGTPHPGIKQRPIVVETATNGHPLAGLYSDPFFELLDRNPTECKGQWDLFEGDGTVGAVTEMLRIEAARAICGRCPIQAECLDYSQRTAQLGLWAGFTDDERKALRRSSNKVGASA